MLAAICLVDMINELNRPDCQSAWVLRYPLRAVWNVSCLKIIGSNTLGQNY